MRAILHASHNLSIQSIFDRLTVGHGVTQYFTSLLTAKKLDPVHDGIAMNLRLTKLVDCAG
jgi:hypothetical protein